MARFDGIRGGDLMNVSRGRSRGWGVCLGLLVFTLHAAGAAAQDFRGGMVGRVSDESGGLLPGVTITVTNRETNVSNHTVTNETGDFTLLYLTPGSYRVAEELQGFKKVNRENVEVRVGDRLQIDFKMEVGGISEVVNVAADTPLLDTRSGSAGGVIGEKQISLMP